jgi:hypothetical protein
MKLGRTKRAIGDEAGAHQAGDPGCVVDVGLAPGYVLDVPRIDHEHLDRAVEHVADSPL